MVGGNVHIDVRKHKTAHLYGPIDVIANPQFLTILKFYDNLKSKLNFEIKTTNFFTSTTGAQLDPRAVNKILRDYVRAEGLCKKKSLRTLYGSSLRVKFTQKMPLLLGSFWVIPLPQH